MKKVQMNQKGFTLVEIIAVLVILGILAAVAVPKYFDMQETAEYKTLNEALNEMKGRATRVFNKSMLENNGSPADADHDSFADLSLGSDAELAAAFKDFANTSGWTFVSDTSVTYTMQNGGASTITFTLTPGTATTPASIAMSSL